MIAIFNGPYTEAMIVKNMLENQGIDVFIANENMALIEPVAISSGGYNTVTLHVDQTDFDRGQQILNDYNSGNLSLDK